MALSSNVPLCAAGDCHEQLRFDFHQLHHEGLLMVGRVLIGNPERWRHTAPRRKAIHCVVQLEAAGHRVEIHQLDHVGLLVMSRVLIVNPERLCGDAAHCKATKIRKARICSVVSCLLSPRRAGR